MNKKDYVTKRLALYVILRDDPDYLRLKRDLKDNVNLDLFSSEWLKRYASVQFGNELVTSYSAAADYYSLRSKAELYPDAVFILRWTRCIGLYMISPSHFVYMRRRYADYIGSTLRKFPCQKSVAS